MLILLGILYLLDITHDFIWLIIIIKRTITCISITMLHSLFILLRLISLKVIPTVFLNFLFLDTFIIEGHVSFIQTFNVLLLFFFEGGLFVFYFFVWSLRIDEGFFLFGGYFRMFVWVGMGRFVLKKAWLGLSLHWLEWWDLRQLLLRVLVVV